MLITNTLKQHKHFTINFSKWYVDNNYNSIININNFLLLDIEFQFSIFLIYFNSLNITIVPDNSGYLVSVSNPLQKCILDKYAEEDNNKYRHIKLEMINKGIVTSITQATIYTISLLDEVIKIEKEPF